MSISRLIFEYIFADIKLIMINDNNISIRNDNGL